MKKNAQHRDGPFDQTAARVLLRTPSSVAPHDPPPAPHPLWASIPLALVVSLPASMNEGLSLTFFFFFFTLVAGPRRGLSLTFFFFFFFTPVAGPRRSLSLKFIAYPGRCTSTASLRTFLRITSVASQDTLPAAYPHSSWNVKVFLDEKISSSMNIFGLKKVALSPRQVYVNGEPQGIMVRSSPLQICSEHSPHKTVKFRS